MRALVVTTFGVPHEGGLSTHVETLCRALMSRGHQVALLEGRAVQASLVARSWGWLRRHLRGDTPADLVAALHRQLTRIEHIGRRKCAVFRPDVVHCHDPIAAVAMLRATKGALPVLETVHGPAVYETRMMRGPGYEKLYEEIVRIEREAFSGASLLLPVDTGQATILQQDYAVPASKMEVVYNCIDVDEVRVFSRRPSPWCIPEPFFLVPRRLVPKTGVRYAIEAMRFLDVPSVHLVIAGDGPLRRELEAYTCQLGLKDRVTFLGSVPRRQLLPLFSRAAGVVVPSVPADGVVEATSLAVTEAMAAGTVPIASAIGGLAELIEDGKTGLLVPPADAQAIAVAMREAMNEKRRLSLVHDASSAVETKYSIPAWIQRIESYYMTFAPPS
jgi:glycosyltransferase involved in cell wall biosynthesis